MRFAIDNAPVEDDDYDNSGAAPSKDTFNDIQAKLAAISGGNNKDDMQIDTMVDR